MQGRFFRALVGAGAGAVAGAVCVALAYTLSPDLRLEFDRDLPRVTSGFYPAEIVRDDSFAWTGRSAVVRMQGVDRRAPWACSVRFRGGRSAPLEQPRVEIAADGIALGGLHANNEYQTLEVTVPPLPSRAGLILTISSSSTFVPGPGDKRELGVQVDAVACRREGSLALPTERVLTASAMAAATFGAGFALIGMALPAALGATAAIAIAQAVPLAAGAAPYGPYPDRVAPLAFWIMLTFVVAALAAERRARQPLSGAARFVLAFSGAALFLELLALLHPSKLVVDAVFHAHRFEWVMGGRYYFTQPMPDGVQFPYAIALYLFAAPWSTFTNDHVTLLRVVVGAAHTLAGALLYVVVTRSWNDRFAAAIAVVLFHLAPLPYIVIGNANLTYAFGQSAAFVTIAAAAVWALRGRDVWQLAALFVLAALAFLSHVGVFPVLMLALIAAAALYWLAGGPLLRAPARSVLIATLLAAVFSVVTYYGQFGEVYTSLDRVRGRATAASNSTAGAPQPQPSAAPIPMHERAGTAVMLALRAFGWPTALLALAGAWDAARQRGRDRLTLVLAALALTYVVFVTLAAWTPVEPRFRKYSDEFIDRVNYATIPLVVVLAARAVSGLWHRGVAGRLAAGVLLAAAVTLGLQSWTAWLR